MLATATFAIDSWEDTPYDEREGARLSRVHLTKTFHGDLEGTSAADLLIAASPVETSRAYVGVERIEGTLLGRRGTFVLLHHAISSGTDGQPTTSWTVLADTGTGDLAGIRGTATIAVGEDGSHSLTLDVSLS